MHAYGYFSSCSDRKNLFFLPKVSRPKKYHSIYFHAWSAISGPTFMNFKEGFSDDFKKCCFRISKKPMI